MKLRNIITTISLIYILSSCTKTLEYDGEQLDPILVLFSECLTGDTLSCHLSKSEFFLKEKKDFTVEEANVDWRVNNGEWQKMSYHKSDDDYFDEYYNTSSSFYKSDYVIKANDHIELRASYKDLKTIYTQHVAPMHPRIELVKIDTLEKSYRVTARLHPYYGAPGVIDYLTFSTEYAVEYKFDNEDFGWTDSYDDFTSDDPLLVKYKDLNTSYSLFEDSDDYSQLVLPVDAITEPYDFIFDITTEKYYHPLQENETARLTLLFLNYYAYSEEHYKARKSMETQDNNSYNPFVEKTQIFSNIENGAGLFSISGRTRRVKTLQ